jgi:hypothetical protein
MAQLIGEAGEEKPPGSRYTLGPRPASKEASVSRLRTMGVTCVVLALASTAACSNKSASPKAADAVLLHASDVPDMRLEGASQALTDTSLLMEALGHGEVFKIEPPAIAAKLSEWGFVRGHLERFLGGGTHAQAFVVELRTAAEARTALAFMYQQLFELCPGEPQCATQFPVSVPDIPSAKGQVVTPFRDQNFGKPFTDYKVLFSVGPLVYGIDVGGDGDFYDPGTVSKDTALAVFKDVYDRVKGLSPDALFKIVPSRPLGPPPDTAVSGSPPPGAPPPPGASSSPSP